MNVPATLSRWRKRAGRRTSGTNAASHDPSRDEGGPAQATRVKLREREFLCGKVIFFRQTSVVKARPLRSHPADETSGSYDREVENILGSC